MLCYNVTHCCVQLILIMLNETKTQVKKLLKLILGCASSLHVYECFFSHEIIKCDHTYILKEGPGWNVTHKLYGGTTSLVMLHYIWQMHVCVLQQCQIKVNPLSKQHLKRRLSWQDIRMRSRKQWWKLGLAEQSETTETGQNKNFKNTLLRGEGV